MFIEREINLISQEKPKGFKEQPVPHAKTIELIKISIEGQTYFSLGENERRLIGMYYFLPGTKLSDLRSYVHPQTGKRVKEVIFESMEKIWENLSLEDKEKLPKNEAIRLKHQSYSNEHIERMRKGPSKETRLKLRQTGLKNGFPPNFEANRLKKIKNKKRPEAVRTAISKTLIKRWKEPSFRESMIKALNRKDINKELWNTAQIEGIIPKIVEKGIMTEQEIEKISVYFKNRKKLDTYMDSLLDRLSIAIANLA